jgi:hypothetical protein
MIREPKVTTANKHAMATTSMGITAMRRKGLDDSEMQFEKS